MARNLPWRRTRDPYAIWVSEIMLQQTQAVTVAPYWERWREELPTVRTLAAAPVDRVLKLWEGLGYYTRARNLKRAAQQVMELHAGHFPTRYEDVLALPGVGRYTAGAVCSIAFDQPTPALDGNVTRVLARLYALDRNIRLPSVNHELWRLAENLVVAAHRRGEPAGCSRLNQALMELGATVCLPRQPACERCPVDRHCAARQQGLTTALPRCPRPPRTIERRFLAAVIERHGRLLVRQRPTGVVNGGLWEFPNVETSGRRELGADVVARLVPGLASAPVPLGELVHHITRYRIHLEVYRVASPRGSRVSVEGKWMTRGQLDRLAFSSAHRKILGLLNA